MDNKYDIFICYSRRDSEFVLSVVKQLQDRGFAIWTDKDIKSGDDFKSVIVSAIKNSDVFLFFSSKSSNESPWIIKEVNMAVHLKKTIIPVRLDNTDYDDSILFDIVGLDFVDFVNGEKGVGAMDKLINMLLSKIAPINGNDIEEKIDWHKDKLFISYKRNDKEKVFAIKDYIEKNTGLSCWIDLDGIESDAQFANVIIKAINNAKVFLFMYSASHLEIEDIDNDWTVREIIFAQKKKKRIVFINIDGTPLTDWFELMFGAKQQIDATSDFYKTKLCKDLKKWLNIEIL